MRKTSILLPSNTVGGLPRFTDTCFALVQINSKIQQPIESYLDSVGVFVPESLFTCSSCTFSDVNLGERITVHYQIVGNYTRPLQYSQSWNHQALISGLLTYKIGDDASILEFNVEIPEISRIKKTPSI